MEKTATKTFSAVPVGQELQVTYDVNLVSNGEDHAVAIVIKKDAGGFFHTAIIDANRGIRRELNQPSIDGFFDDFRKQASGDVTKSGHKRKLHTWHNAIITARLVDSTRQL